MKVKPNPELKYTTPVKKVKEEATHMSNFKADKSINTISFSINTSNKKSQSPTLPTNIKTYIVKIKHKESGITIHINGYARKSMIKIYKFIGEKTKIKCVLRQPLKSLGKSITTKVDKPSDDFSFGEPKALFTSNTKETKDPQDSNPKISSNKSKNRISKPGSHNSYLDATLSEESINIMKELAIRYLENQNTKLNVHKKHRQLEIEYIIHNHVRKLIEFEYKYQASSSSIKLNAEPTCKTPIKAINNNSIAEPKFNSISKDKQANFSSCSTADSNNSRSSKLGICKDDLWIKASKTGEKNRKLIHKKLLFNALMCLAIVLFLNLMMVKFQII